MIELVIKIDEKYLEYMHKAVEVDCTAPPYFVVQNLLESVLNGTLLPKGHGRLIDADAIEYTHAVARSLNDWHIWDELCVTKDEIADAPTIIEGE